MPRYINESTYPIYYNNTVFAPQVPNDILDVINTQAFIFGLVTEPYAIVGGVNDTLLLRFNNETTWTTVTLTAGAAQTVLDIAADINTTYGVTVATVEGGRIKITAPRRSSDLSAAWLSTTGTANATLGLTGHDHNPSGLAARQAFLNGTQLATYNITTANNKFIFKFGNDLDWTIATLTTGAARTAQQIADDINNAYWNATGKYVTVAQSVELITGSGDTQVQLIAPVYANYCSSIYIKTTNNTALAVLGFDSDNILPLVINGYPQLILINILPLFNPLLSTTTITFTGAGWSTFYINTLTTRLDFSRINVEFNIYIEDISNLPPINLISTETFSLINKVPKIDKLIIQAIGAGHITILEYK